MNWELASSELLTTISQARNKDELISDLSLVYQKIQNDHAFKSKEILAFIDATNGIIYFSGLDEQNGNNIDSLIMSVGIPEIWEQNDNAYDFDEVVLLALKAALSYNKKRESKTISYKIIAETELGDKTALN
jgi:tRNA A37 threonylcarbamoyladenosine modification protein TsaB